MNHDDVKLVKKRHHWCGVCNENCTLHAANSNEPLPSGTSQLADKFNQSEVNGPSMRRLCLKGAKQYIVSYEKYPNLKFKQILKQFLTLKQQKSKQSIVLQEYLQTASLVYSQRPKKIVLDEKLQNLQNAHGLPNPLF